MWLSVFGCAVPCGMEINDQNGTRCGFRSTVAICSARSTVIWTHLNVFVYFVLACVELVKLNCLFVTASALPPGYSYRFTALCIVHLFNLFTIVEGDAH